MLRMPSVAQKFENVWRDWPAIEREPDIDREPPLLPQIGVGELRDHVVEAERRDLRQIGIGRQAKAARCRQPGASERRQIGSLRPDPCGINLSHPVERNDKPIRRHRAR